MGGDAAYALADSFADLLPKSWRPKVTLDDFPVQSEQASTIGLPSTSDGQSYVPQSCLGAAAVLGALASPSATQHVITQFGTSGALDTLTVGVGDVGAGIGPLEVMQQCNRLKWTDVKGTIDGRPLGLETSCKWKPTEGAAPTNTSGVFAGTCIEYNRTADYLRKVTSDMTVMVIEDGDNALIVYLRENRKLQQTDELGIDPTISKSIPLDKKVTRAGLVAVAPKLATAFTTTIAESAS